MVAAFGSGPAGFGLVGAPPRYCVTAELVRLRFAAPSLRDLFRAGVAATFPRGRCLVCTACDLHLFRLRSSRCVARTIHSHYNYGISQWYYANTYKCMFVCTCILVFVSFILVVLNQLLINLAVALMLQRIRKCTAHEARGHDKNGCG